MVRMLMRTPSWMEPVDSFGDWFGLLGGLVVLPVTIGAAIWLGVHPIRLVSDAIPNGGQGTASPAWFCIDPTDPCNWSSYQVRNDSQRVVVLRECMHHCGAGDQVLDPITIRPGDTTANNVYDVSAGIGVYSWWEVLTPSGVRLGCLILDGHSKKHDGDLVLVSETSRCGNAASPPTRPVEVP